MTIPFLKTHQGKIIGPNARPLALKGVNLGGWLLMEGYILHSLNIAARAFKKDFAKKRGQKTLKQFEKDFRDTFIQEKDFEKIARLGFNCVRVPFHHHLIEPKPYGYDENGLLYLDRAIRWAKKYDLYIILDLHAAPGCQNRDWHSDSLGKAQLWSSKEYQDRTVALWKFLASRYQSEPTIAGYDLINESVVANPKALNRLYKKIINAIRSVDPHHIIFLEGNLWATDIACLDTFEDHNYAYSIHFYHPLDFTFNFVPELFYPQRLIWTKKISQAMIDTYAKQARKVGVPVLVGEFGVNGRQNLYGEGNWLKDLLRTFDKHHFHWTYWTYKAVKHAQFPDGILSYYPNPAWVNRQGPESGWATYARLWPEHRKEIVESWKTQHFKLNHEIVSVLKDAAL